MKRQVKTKLSDEEIFDLIKPDLDATVEYMGEVSRLRHEDMDRLRGVPYPGDKERKLLGHSTSISKVIANTVDWTQPGLVEIFSGDFYRFKFSSPSFSTGLKDLVDKIWFRQQKGEETNDTFIYDAQTNRTGGIVKTYYHEEYDLESEEYERLTEQQFREMQEDQDTEITRYDEITETTEEDTDAPDLDGILPGLNEGSTPNIIKYYDNVKTVKKITVFKGPKIENVKPERFGVSPECNGNLKKARLVYDWSVRNLDYVKRMEKVGTFRKGSVARMTNEIPNDDYQGVSQATDGEADNRFYVEGTATPLSATKTGTLDSDKKEMKPANDFKMYQLYLKMDIDGDGLLEPVIITTSGNIIFSIEENVYGSPPFVIGKPFRIPHQNMQQTYGEMLAEDQKMMTNLNRMQQDTAARSTYSNPITNDRQTFDQLKKRKPADVIFGDPEKIGALPNPDSSQFILKSIEMFQSDIENRTGVTKYNQGLDSNSLNKTFGGIQLIMTASQKRQRLVARRFGWAFRDIIYNIVKILELYPTDDFIKLLQDNRVIAGSVTIDDVVVDVGVSFEEKFAMSQQLEKLGLWHIQVGIPTGISTTTELLNTIKKQYSLLNINTEGLLPSDDEHKQREQAKQQSQPGVGGPQMPPQPGNNQAQGGQQQAAEGENQQLVG